MRLILDMASYMWTALRAGKDPDGIEAENSNGKVEWVNRAAWGYENAVNSILNTVAAANCQPKDIVAVFEGVNTKARRLMINSEYKANRGKSANEAYIEYQALKYRLEEALYNLGAISVTQDNVEGDDVLAHIAININEDCVVSSFDNDIAVLAGANKHGKSLRTYINHEWDVNRYGYFPTKYITLYKAMVGDSKDNIKGIPGFGEAAWKEFHRKFGEAGMAEMVRLAELGTLAELEEEAEQDKLIKKIWDKRDEFLNSYRLAKLHPEWVDTMSDALQFKPGMVTNALTDSRFRPYRAGRRLITPENVEQFFEFFTKELKTSPFVTLDIETSTPEESDEWLRAMEADPLKEVDVVGSYTVGMSVTFGANCQHTVYIPVAHEVSERNLDKSVLARVITTTHQANLETVIHNTSFEGTVLYNDIGELLKPLGFGGFIPNWLDTVFEASYVDENNPLGLKKLSKRWLNYDQQEYEDVVTRLVPEGAESEGTLVSQVETSPGVWCDKYRLKMHQMTAEEVFSYACDDTVVTAALHNFFSFVMALENTYEVYKQVELRASYTHVKSFTHGTRLSLAKLRELEAEDAADEAKAWETLQTYLIQNGWEGCVCPHFTEIPTPAQVKEIFKIVTGTELTMSVRKPEKMLEVLAKHRQEDSGELVYTALEEAFKGNLELVNMLVSSRFVAKPDFNIDSPNQKVELLYTVMQLPVRVRNKLTPAARAKGEKQGSPSADALAIAYAKRDAPEELQPVLEALTIISMVGTRKKLYYKPYPRFVHWKTRRIHSSHRQCATNTRRASAAKPNVQQVSKNEKVEGYTPRIREVYIPHKRNAVVVSMDFKAQELGVIADYSRDENMLACFIGDNKRDMHALTGLGIFNETKNLDWSYDTYIDAMNDDTNEYHKEVKKTRKLGKQTNFTSEYGAQAPKLASVLLVEEGEAQLYLDKKAEAFPGVVKWKEQVMAEAREKGYVTTKMGARRHLRDALLSSDRYVASKADRQAVNTKVQGSSAEMTKLAEGRMWERRLEERYDCEIMFPVHDEIVASVSIEDVPAFIAFIKEMHWCMVQPYADMFVPITSSIAFGLSFGPAHQIEIGEEPTDEAIKAGLEQVYKQMKELELT